MKDVRHHGKLAAAQAMLDFTLVTLILEIKLVGRLVYVFRELRSLDFASSDYIIVVL